MKQHFKTSLFLLPFFLSFMVPVSAFEGADAAGMIKNPIIETVLAAVILISIAAEIKTAGFSGGVLAAAIAGCILIGANWYEEKSFFWEFILYFGGLVLIFLDIFLLMSGAGILCGLVLVLGGLFLTFGGDITALYILSFSILASAGGGSLFHSGPSGRQPFMEEIDSSYGTERKQGIRLFRRQPEGAGGEKRHSLFCTPAFRESECGRTDGGCPVGRHFYSRRKGCHGR